MREDRLGSLPDEIAISPAKKRLYIPRGSGVRNLSGSPLLLEISEQNYPSILSDNSEFVEDLFLGIRREAKIMDARKETLLTRFADFQRERAREYDPADKVLFSPPLWVAPDSEDLMDEVSVVMTQLFDNPHLLVDDYGYPMPFWKYKVPYHSVMGASFSALPEISIYEGNLVGAIRQQKRIPKDITAVYLDIPRTYGEQIPDEDVVKFINQTVEYNPDMLFIIDQANTGFGDGKSLVKPHAQSDLALLSLLDPKARVVVMNSLSKDVGTGFAWLQASDALRTELKEQFLGFYRIKDYDRAIELLEREGDAQKKRRKLLQNRNAIASRLPEGALPFGEGVNPHLIVDATKLGLGYTNAQEMVDAFAEEHNLIIKTCEPYAASGNTQVRTHVFIAVPVDKEVFGDLRRALQLA